jgi:hypothetical protein
MTKILDRSAIIRERLFEVIHNGELNNQDLVKIVSRIINDILNAQTRASYRDRINPKTGKKYCYNSHQFAKGERFLLRGIEFITDNE